MNKIILLVTLLLSFKLTFAQPGQLDPFFANKGIAKSDLGARFNADISATQVLVQANGSMFVLLEVFFKQPLEEMYYSQTLIAKRKANGSADSSYGTFGFSNAVVMGDPLMAVQSDGKIVVVGDAYNGEGNGNDVNEIVLVRYNTDGRLDNTFNSEGIDGGGIVDDAYSIAIQKDGKILVASNSGLDRFNTNGSLDNTFYLSNWYTFLDSEAGISQVSVQSDGKIVVVGRGNGDVAGVVARYKSDGTLDSTFNRKGYQTSDYYITSVALQTDGKIVAGGSFLTRYNSNGSIDNTFSGDGIQSSDFNITSLSIQTDGKILAAGQTALARYNINGTLDNTFSGDGKLSTEFAIASVSIQGDGKIVGVGNSSSTNFTIVRYSTTGNLDVALNGNGKLIDNLHLGFTTFKGTAVQTDGKIVTAGYTWNGSNFDFVVARYNTDGRLDKSFSVDGYQNTDFGSATDLAKSVIIQSDRKIVVAGSSAGNFALARYNPDGTLDNTFSGDGKQITDFGSSEDNISSVVIQTDGKIVVAGSGMARYNTNGSLDASFHADGKVTTLFFCNDVAVQRDGKLVTVGGDKVARYNSDGSLDIAFGSRGVQIFPENEDYFSRAQSIAIQSDGKLVVGGTWQYYWYGDGSKFAIARYKTDGSFDSSFASDGLQLPYLTGFDYINSLALQSDGKIVVAGGTGKMADDFALARLNTNGSIDPAFGSNGIQITAASTGNNSIQSIAIANNKLYAVGYGENPYRFGAVARYLLAANKPPTVSITTPVNNTVYYAPATINISAVASDADGAIKNVAFYNGSTLLNTDNISPYSFSWKNVPAGTYYLKAKATDNFGLSTTSTTVKVTVLPNKAPVVSITSPANNSTYTAPAKINITASAYDPDGTIKNVKFYRGSTLIKTDSVSPYSYSWSNVAAGTYYLTAKATDNRGVSTTSPVVKVSVAAARLAITSNSVNQNDDGTASIKLYPNPVGNIINIITTGLQPGKPVTLSVVSASGVIMKTVQSNSSIKTQPLDVSSFVSGVYIIKVIYGDRLMYKQFVKL